MNFIKKISPKVVAFLIIIYLSFTFTSCPTAKPIEETTEEVEEISETLTENEKVEETTKITEEETTEETTEEPTTKEGKSPIPFENIDETYEDFIDEAINTIVYMYEVIDAINSKDLKAFKENNDILVESITNLGELRKELDIMILLADTDNTIEKEKIKIIKDSIDIMEEMLKNIVDSLKAKIDKELTKYEESLKGTTTSFEKLMDLVEKYRKLQK